MGFKIKQKKLKKLQTFLNGLTLIEVLIAIAILALLISSFFIVIPTQFKKARDARRKMNLDTIRKALEDYYNIQGFYPKNLPHCGAGFTIEEVAFISEFPCDPKSQTGYVYLVDESEKSNWFKIYTNLEYLTDSVIDFVGCRGGCGPECQYNYGVSSTNTSLDSCAVKYVCAPGGGSQGNCEVFADPEISECPKVYLDNPTCNNECSDHKNRCKNSKGKYIPKGK